MYWTFEEGEDDYTMGHVLSWAKDKYTTPKNRRQELALCDRVLDDTSTDLETPIRTYLHRYCRKKVGHYPSNWGTLLGKLTTS